MPDDTLKPGLLRALQLHEIGSASPYRLFFAGKGKSGASFGFMQGDLAAGQPVAQETFRAVLEAAGVPAAKARKIEEALSVHLIANPLSEADAALVNDALDSPAGRPLVDAMDEEIAKGVFKELDRCIAAAASSGRKIQAKAQIYMALWINMTGPPSVLLRWLRGQAVQMAKPMRPPPPSIVTAAATEAYLLATDYYTENPRNFEHMKHCTAEGAALLA